MTATLLMFDTAASDYGPVPADAQAIAPYMDRKFRNVDAARVRFPALFAAGRVLTLTAAKGDADGIDWEPGNLDPPPRAWYDQQHARGRFRPCFYADTSDMRATVIPDLEAHLGPLGPPGPTRPVRIFAAHPTGTPHICGPQTCGELPVDADAGQFWFTSIQGRFPGALGDVDVSLVRADFFQSVAQPKPPTPEEIMAIAAATNHDGRIELFVEHTDGSIWHTYQQYAEGTQTVAGWAGGEPNVTAARLSPLAPPPGK